MQVGHNELKKDDGTQSVSQDVLYSGTAKAWSNLNGTGTIAERDSYNISSYTDNGTGDYSPQINADMANVNYSVVGMSNAVQMVIREATTWSGTDPTTGAFRIYHRNASDVAIDVDFGCWSVDGDLA